jgi:phosphatidylserine/phosphatidylglycerophosphate/cardiolipin synthase-like enzyme
LYPQGDPNRISDPAIAHDSVPQSGQIVGVRQRLFLTEEVQAPINSKDSALVRLSCIDDDAQGQPLEILWDKELDARILSEEAWDSIARRGFDPGRQFSAFRTLAERMNQEPNLQVQLYLDIQRSAGDTSAESEIIRRFVYEFKTSQWPDNAPIPEIFYDPRALESNRANRAALHAKCIVVDGHKVFVSSANFTQYAQERNIEIGLSLRSHQVALRITNYLEELVECKKLCPAIRATGLNTKR